MSNSFNKTNLDTYFKELGKEFRKLNGKKIPAEIILIDGASILINYGFRETTNDVDAIIIASSAMKQAINNVGDRLNSPNNWLNKDFEQTDSYSSKLIQYSKYYKTFSNILTIRTVSSEYLIAMKLKSFRAYKFDRSDVIGILSTEKLNGTPLSLEQIKQAIIVLYGSYDSITNEAKAFIETAVELSDYEERYQSVRNEEIDMRKFLINFEAEYPSQLKQSNLEDVLAIARKKRSEQ